MGGIFLPMKTVAQSSVLGGGRRALLSDNEWLSVSLEGFSQQNKARPVEHLIKELVQNSLDALGGAEGKVTLDILECPRQECIVRCRDNGTGVSDMKNLRTVFWTSKHDSRFKRGRMGRGFKELLSLCRECRVVSGGQTAVFDLDGLGQRRFSVFQNDETVYGTCVEMTIDGDANALTGVVRRYFSGFLPPKGVTLEVCGETIKERTPVKVITGSLPTEEFVNGRWTRPRHKANIEIVECEKGEKGLIYEMGIPVCPLEWDIRYHVNVLQRVPMNPNRDAVMSGYGGQIHKICLPHLLDRLSSENTRSSWVGEAAVKCRDEELQQRVLRKAFGDNLARSVPDFGKFSHDADAQENAGVSILDTKQLTGGFRELARKHVPTSAEIAKESRVSKYQIASETGETPDQAGRRYDLLMSKRGRDTVQHVCNFHKWLADGVLATLFPGAGLKCKVQVADFRGCAEGTWTNQFQTLTLALDLDRIWTHPTHPENFSLLVHETAHELAAHHGRSFASAVETAAGACCEFLFRNMGKLPDWRFPK